MASWAGAEPSNPTRGLTSRKPHRPRAWRTADGGTPMASSTTPRLACAGLRPIIGSNGRQPNQAEIQGGRAGGWLSARGSTFRVGRTFRGRCGPVLRPRDRSDFRDIPVSARRTHREGSGRTPFSGVGGTPELSRCANREAGPDAWHIEGNVSSPEGRRRQVAACRFRSGRSLCPPVGRGLPGVRQPGCCKTLAPCASGRTWRCGAPELCEHRNRRARGRESVGPHRVWGLFVIQEVMQGKPGSIRTGSLRFASPESAVDRRRRFYRSDSGL